MILRATERLHALPVFRRRLIDVLRHRARPDERNRAHQRMLQQRVNCDLIAMNQVEDALRNSHVVKQFARPRRRHRHLFRRLQDKRVAAGDREREHPHRHHSRKIKGTDPGANAKWLTNRYTVDPAGDVFERIAHHQRRHSAGDFHHLDRSLHGKLCVIQRLAVFRGKNLRDLVDVLVEQRLVAIQHLHPLDHRHFAPFQERGVREFRHPIDLGRRGKRYLRNHLPHGWIGDGMQRAFRVLPLSVHIKLQGFGSDHGYYSFFINDR